jgi:hypothetical protein
MQFSEPCSELALNLNSRGRSIISINHDLLIQTVHQMIAFLITLPQSHIKMVNLFVDMIRVNV